MDPLTILSVCGGVGFVFLSFGFALKLARSNTSVNNAVPLTTDPGAPHQTKFVEVDDNDYHSRFLKELRVGRFAPATFSYTKTTTVRQPAEKTEKTKPSSKDDKKSK